MRGHGPFQFTAVELFVLAAGFAVTSFFVFLLGMYVGREVAFEHAPIDSRVARVPIDPASRRAVVARPKAAFARLAAAKPRPVSKSPAKPVSRAAPTAGKPKGDSGAVSEPEPQKVAARKGGRVEPAPRSVPAEIVVARTERQAYGAKLAPPPPLPSRAPTAAAESSPRRRGSGGTFLLTESADRMASVRSLPSARRPSAAARGSSPADLRSRRAPVRMAAPAYTVQVLSTRDGGAAESLVRSLKARGYGAYVRPAQDSTGRWFRVRIGRFGELDSARALAARCRKDLRLDQAYVISD